MFTWRSFLQLHTWQRARSPRAKCFLLAFTLTLASSTLALEPSQPGLKVALVIADLTNPYFSFISRQVEAAVLARDSDAETMVMSSGYDLSRQTAQIERVAADGYDILFLNAVDTHKVASSIETAIAAGVVVVALDVAADGAQITVTSDNYTAGVTACDYLAERLGGHGDVVILNGPPVSAVQDRVAGCGEALSRHAGIKILSDAGDSGGSMLGGLTYMSSLLTTLPHIDAVFSMNDPTALGGDEAARQAGRDEFFIVSIDASPAVVGAMGQPDSRLIASVYQDPKAMAERAVEMAFALRDGKFVSSDPVLMPVRLVTRDTLDAFVPWEE
jgi:ribose transport system substrate-binding protein